MIDPVNLASDDFFVFRRHIVKNRGKFVASHTEYIIGGTEALFQKSRYLPKSLIADLMSISVIDGLEFINIDQEQGVRRSSWICSKA